MNMTNSCDWANQERLVKKWGKIWEGFTSVCLIVSTHNTRLYFLFLLLFLVFIEKKAKKELYCIL